MSVVEIVHLHSIKILLSFFAHVDYVGFYQRIINASLYQVLCDVSNEFTDDKH